MPGYVPVVDDNGNAEVYDCPRGYYPVKQSDGTIKLVKKEQMLCDYKITCECGVRVSSVDKRALLRHQSTKGHLEWASRQLASMRGDLDDPEIADALGLGVNVTDVPIPVLPLPSASSLRKPKRSRSYGEAMDDIADEAMAAMADEAMAAATAVVATAAAATVTAGIQPDPPPDAGLAGQPEAQPLYPCGSSAPVKAYAVRSQAVDDASHKSGGLWSSIEVPRRVRSGAMPRLSRLAQAQASWVQPPMPPISDAFADGSYATEAPLSDEAGSSFSANTDSPQREPHPLDQLADVSNPGNCFLQVAFGSWPSDLSFS